MNKTQMIEILHERIRVLGNNGHDEESIMIVSKLNDLINRIKNLKASEVKDFAEQYGFNN